MIDNDNGYLPDFMVATTGKVHEINVAKILDDQPGCITWIVATPITAGGKNSRGKAFISRHTTNPMTFMMNLDGAREDDIKHCG